MHTTSRVVIRRAMIMRGMRGLRTLKLRAAASSGDTERWERWTVMLPRMLHVLSHAFGASHAQLASYGTKYCTLSMTTDSSAGLYFHDL